jgi:hypothetical protein
MHCVTAGVDAERMHGELDTAPNDHNDHNDPG